MKSPPGPPARLLTDDEAATYIGASRSYVRALIERGVLRRVELPTTDGSAGRARLLRLDVRDLDLWLDSLPRH
jgi:excisionase family DNA binding protein